MGQLIRPAELRDAADIGRIYNHYVFNSVCTFQIEPDSLEDSQSWVEAHTPDGPHPAFVYERDGQVVGWASLGSYKPRDAYQHTAETSIYVAHDHHGQGIGRALLERLIEAADQIGHHTLLAQIAEGGPSEELHRRFGFEVVGRLCQVGRKFDRWIDVIVMQKMLGS